MSSAVYMAGALLVLHFTSSTLTLVRVLIGNAPMQVITWKLELEDGKCRPSGSPPRDTSLAAFASADGAEPAAAGCPFPEHSSHCRCARWG